MRLLAWCLMQNLAAAQAEARNLFDAATGELSAAAKRLHMDCGECLCVSANEETLREAQRLGMKCMLVGADAAQPVFITSKE